MLIVVVQAALIDDKSQNIIHWLTIIEVNLLFHIQYKLDVSDR